MRPWDDLEAAPLGWTGAAKSVCSPNAKRSRHVLREGVSVSCETHGRFRQPKAREGVRASVKATELPWGEREEDGIE